jgi:hypothetical protein
MNIDVVRSAYRKLKSFIYYDTTNLLLRRQLADFEAEGSADARLTALREQILQGDPSSPYWKGLLSSMSYRKFAKQFEHVETEPSSLISNRPTEKTHKVDRVTNFVDAPIELHICSALWLVLIGYRLEELMQVPPFGNKIELETIDGEVKPVDGLKFYKKYFNQYRDWRDGAVKAAKKLVENDKNALILGLDVRNYYHSVRLDLDAVHERLFEDEIPENLKALCRIFMAIHTEYTKLFFGKQLAEKGQVILPIGLMSSGALANYYLADFDTKVISTLRPDFYGRYVDDILIVTSCPDDQETDNIGSIAKQYLVDPDLCEETAEGVFAMVDLPEITIQSQKLSALHFVSTEPTALLDKFIGDIRRNSSEYRWLPEDESIDYDFDEAAYSLNYTGSGNKLRDIKEFGEDKFGISKFLAKKIFLALQSGHSPDSTAVDKVVRFFKGRRAIELYTLWERVFVFLLVNRATDNLISVAHEFLNAIREIQQGKATDWDDEDRQSYLDHLFCALSLALSLKPSLLRNEKFLLRLKQEVCKDSNWNIEAVRQCVEAIRQANMVRHTYIVHPLLNYVDKDKNQQHFDLIDFEHYFSGSRQALEIEKEKYRYSPRFVHFHEVTLFHIQNRVSTGNSKFFRFGFHFGSRIPKSSTDYLDAAFDDYYRLNYSRHLGGISRSSPHYQDMKKDLYRLEAPDRSNNWTRKLTLGGDDSKTMLRVAIANMKIPDEVTSHPYLRNPTIASGRRRLLHGILNQAEEERADMLIMPEISVPVGWFKWLADYSLRKSRCIVFGLEHWVVVNRAFNFLVCMMPVRVNGFMQLVIDIRLKNHYSPGEVQLLQGYGYVIPVSSNPYYDLIVWQGIHFTSFNCFELSNIADRSRFKAIVDLLTVAEFNRDTPYFSNLVESCTRDLHCFVAQVNDSRFGDSRICQPASSLRLDLVKVKGGENATIMVATLDIDELREFQLKEHSGQKDFGVFKPTPPDFDRKAVELRMKK